MNPDQLGAQQEASRPPSSESLELSRGLKSTSVLFGVLLGAYISQKLKSPLGLDGDDRSYLFWAFFLTVMALLTALFLGIAVVLGRARRR